MLTNTVNAWRIASVRHIATDVNELTHTVVTADDTCGSLAAGRGAPQSRAAGAARGAEDASLRVHPQPRRHPQRPLFMVSPIDDHFRVIRLGIRDKLGCICRIFTLLRRIKYRSLTQPEELKS